MVFKIEGDSEKSIPLHVKPVFSVIKEVIFAVNIDNEWVKITPTGKVNFEENSYDNTILTLLEESYDILNSQISAALRERNIDGNLVNTFPFNIVMLSGLKSGTSYWMQLAFNWLETNKSLINTEVISAVKLIPNNKKYSQKIRHTAMKIYKEIKLD